jgi:hypothetical protein
MGFHTRHLNEETLRRIYKKDSVNGIFLLYITADAIDSEDKFTSEVTDFFCDKFSREEIAQKIKEKFSC